MVHDGMSGSSGAPAVSFQSEADTDADPALELEVLKCILLREGYIDRLQKEASKGRALVANKQAAAKLVDLLDLIRQVTVETCEAIQRWRYTSKRPFMWNGMNYLLKVCACVGVWVFLSIFFAVCSLQCCNFFCDVQCRVFLWRRWLLWVRLRSGNGERWSA